MAKEMKTEETEERVDETSRIDREVRKPRETRLQSRKLQTKRIVERKRNGKAITLKTAYKLE